MSKCRDNIEGSIYKDPSTAIRVESGKDIQVTERNEFGVKIFTVNSKPYIAPSITTIVTPEIAEVGTIVSNVDIQAIVNRGSETIESVTSDPEHLFTEDTNGDYTTSWSETNVSAFAEGLHPLYGNKPTSIKVRDSLRTSTKEVGVMFYYPAFILSSDSDTLSVLPSTNKIIENDLFVSNEVEEFTEDDPKYLYWVQVDKPTKRKILRVTINDLPVPIVELPSITKQYAGELVTFRVVRTAIKSTYNKTKLKIWDHV